MGILSLSRTMYWVEEIGHINSAWMDGSNHSGVTVLTYALTGLAIDPESKWTVTDHRVQ